MDEEVKVTITGKVSYEKVTNEFRAGQIIAFLNSDQQPLPHTIVPNNTQVANRTMLSEIIPRRSPREALEESGARTNPQKIAALGKYVMDKDNTLYFAIGAVKDALKKAGESLPRNFGRDLREAIKMGYITESDQQSGEYILTDKGGLQVESGFIDKSAKSDNSGRRKNRKRKNVPSVGPARQRVLRTEITEQLSIATVSDKFGQYPYDSTKGIRIMWIVGYAEENGIDKLSTPEIEYISQKLRDNIPANTFSALTNPFVKKGFLQPLQSGFTRLLHGGAEYLENLKRERELPVT